MSENIALLLQRHFIEHCKKEIGDRWQDCSLSYIEYESLEQLQQIFNEVKNDYDAFITSGAVPMNAIKDIDTPPFVITGYFGGYLENTYRILLNQLLKRGRAEAGRIGLDYLDGRMSLEDILKKDQLPELVNEFERGLIGLSEKDLEEREKRIVEKYLKQCGEGELDFVVTCFYSVVNVLQKMGVECYYAYPSKKSLLETIDLCLKNVHMEQIRKHMPAVIRVTPDASFRTGKNSSNQELELLNLKSAILEYCKYKHIEPVLKDDFGDVEVYLNTDQIQSLTGKYRSFDLPLHLKEKAQFHGFVSVGSGEDLNKARFRAIQARDYGMRMGQEVSIFIDEREEVHSMPIGSRKDTAGSGVPSAYVEQVANASHLSSETVYRVIAAMQAEKTREFTAPDLVWAQDFSLRIATRVLTALANAGYAKRIGQKRIGNKGRPQNLYLLDLEYEKGTVA